MHDDDKEWYYQVDKSKIKQGAKAGRWIRAKVIRAAPRSSMVVIDLGTRTIQINQSLLRRNMDLFSGVDILMEDLGVPAPAAPPAPMASSSSSSRAPAPVDTEDIVEDGSASYAHALWQCLVKGKLDLLELFAVSARLSQCASLRGLKVCSPIGFRAGFDLNTRACQKWAMQDMLEQKLEVVHMSPLCSPWCFLISLKGEEAKAADRKAAMPIVKFCAQVAVRQIKTGRQFVIENLRESTIWHVHYF